MSDPGPDSGKDSRISSSSSSGGSGEAGQEDEGPCSKACEDTYCGSPPKNPDPGCGECLQGSLQEGEACAAPVSEACGQVEDCGEFNTCAEECLKGTGECGDTTDDVRGQPVDAGPDAKADAGPDAATPVDAGPDSGNADAGKADAGKGDGGVDQQKCGTCCQQKHPKGQQTIANAVRKCGCAL